MAGNEAAYELNTGVSAPFRLDYIMTIRNKDTEYIVEVEDGSVKITRGIDSIPAKMSFKAVNDAALDFTEGNHVTFTVNGTTVFSGYVFSKSRDKKSTITVTAYDQLRYLKNKDCYVYYDKTATEVIKMIAEDYGLTLGDVANTEYKIPKRIEKNKTLMDIINTALYLTEINNHKVYHLYDDDGKIILNSSEGMKLDLYVDADTMENYECNSSIDKDTYDYIKVVRNVPDGERKVLKRTGVVVDENHVKEWGRLQQLYIPDDKVTNAIDMAINMIKAKNRKTRDLRLKNVLGDVRVRGGSLIYLKHNFGDLDIDAYVAVESVTHKFYDGIHLMDLDLWYQEPVGNYEIKYNTDSDAVAKIKEANAKQQASHQTIGGASPYAATNGSMGSQVDTAFQLNEGRVSPYGSVGCADTVCAAGSYYNTDLAEEYNKGVASVPTLRADLEAKGYTVESFNGYANKGDLLIYGDDDHVVISDGAGGCFGNSSSAGYAHTYSDANYAWHDGEPPTKVIRMGVQ